MITLYPGVQLLCRRELDRSEPVDHARHHCGFCPKFLCQQHEPDQETVHAERAMMDDPSLLRHRMDEEGAWQLVGLGQLFSDQPVFGAALAIWRRSGFLVRSPGQ